MFKYDSSSIAQIVITDLNFCSILMKPQDLIRLLLLLLLILIIFLISMMNPRLKLCQASLENLMIIQS